VLRSAHEPGGIRTNWQRRAGQNTPELLTEYEASVGSMLKVLRGLEGRSEGDSAKIADVIVQLANSDEVPLRLILGVDAEKRVQQVEASRASGPRNGDISKSQRFLKMDAVSSPSSFLTIRALRERGGRDCASCQSKPMTKWICSLYIGEG